MPRGIYDRTKTKNNKKSTVEKAKKIESTVVEELQKELLILEVKAKVVRELIESFQDR